QFRDGWLNSEQVIFSYYFSITVGGELLMSNNTVISNIWNQELFFKHPWNYCFPDKKNVCIIIGTTCIGFCAAAGEHTKVQFTVSYVHYRVTITPLYPIINYIPLYAIISYYIDV
ncbi:unnamed protein product, partial [Ascophyllum nodosum]